MTDLIARLERGERREGDNAEVLRAMGWDIEGGDCYAPGSEKPHNIASVRPLDSVDDAMRLVPDGWLPSIFRMPYGGWSAEVQDWSSGDEGDGFEAKAPTAARALTIAILRTLEN